MMEFAIIPLIGVFGVISGFVAHKIFVAPGRELQNRVWQLEGERMRAEDRADQLEAQVAEYRKIMLRLLAGESLDVVVGLNTRNILELIRKD